MAGEGETQPILQEVDGIQTHNVYKRRWWVTVVFCMTCFIQALTWNTWAPIAESSELVFGWTDGTIAAITNMSSIIYAILILPFGSFIDAYGFKIPQLVCVSLLLACCVVRCITMEPEIFTPLAYLSSTLQGIGGMMPFGGNVLVAATWFTVYERAYITAVTSFFNYFGICMDFIIAPQLVPGPVYNVSTNATEASGEIVGSHNVTNMESMKTGIKSLLYLHTLLAGITFIMSIVYFPAKPPTPPSITASLPKVSYKNAFRKLLVNGQLWLIMIVGAVPRSFVGSWTAVFDIVVKPLGVSQIDAGWISFWHTLAGCLAGMMFVRLSVIMNNRRKIFINSLTIIALAFCIWAALICDEIMPFSLMSLYVSSIILVFIVDGPSFYEMCAEAAYPVGEGFAGCFFTMGLTFFEIVYFGLLSIPGIGVSWMSWSCVGSLIVSLPLMMMFKERNKRFEIDAEIQTQPLYTCAVNSRYSLDSYNGNAGITATYDNITTDHH